jgi:translation elongation factor EF-1alpha
MAMFIGSIVYNNGAISESLLRKNKPLTKNKSKESFDFFGIKKQVSYVKKYFKNNVIFSFYNQKKSKFFFDLFFIRGTSLKNFRKLYFLNISMV